MDIDVTRIDRQAWAWHKKLIDQWCGQAPACHPHREALIAALFLHHEMPNGPLPHDRLELVQMATSRENPSKEAFVTLALVDYLEDLATLPVGERSAKLPYQLAWARAGFSLVERTGLPGGIHKARWPDVAVASIGAAGQPGQQRPVEPGGLRPVRVEGSADIPGRPDPEAPKPRRPEAPPQEALPGLHVEPVSGVQSAIGGVDAGAGASQRRRRARAA